MSPIGRTPPQPRAAIMQWDNGRGKWRTRGEKGWHQGARFHIETGRSEEFDRLMHAAGVPQLEFYHPPKNGSAAKATVDWDLGTLVGLYPITSGPPVDKVSGITLDAATAQVAAEAGIGLRWRQGEKSLMAVRCFLALPVLAEGVRVDLEHPDAVRALIAALATPRAEKKQVVISWKVILSPVQFGVSSNTSDLLLAALVEHRRAIEAADNLVDRSLHPEVVTFHELLLPLAIGPEVEWASRDPQKGGSATVVSTFVACHPSKITRAYVEAPGMWRGKVLHEQAEMLFPGIQVWAHGYRRSADRGVAPAGASFDNPVEDEEERAPQRSERGRGDSANGGGVIAGRGGQDNRS